MSFLLHMFPWAAGALLVVWGFIDLKHEHKRDAAFLFGLAALDLSGTAVATFDARDTDAQLVTTSRDLKSEQDARTDLQQKLAVVQDRVEPRRLSHEQIDVIGVAISVASMRPTFTIQAPIGDAESQGFASELALALSGAGWSTRWGMTDRIPPQVSGIVVAYGVVRDRGFDGTRPSDEALSLFAVLQKASLNPRLAPWPQLAAGDLVVMVGRK